MRKFRLQWARRCGEDKAAEHGYDAFPVDPFEIARNEDILVEPKRPDQIGVSGGIIFQDDSVGIFYSTDIDNDGFQRFTVAHELGHYYLEGHPEEILKAAPIHVSRAGFTESSSSIEMEADHFASGLLLPTRLVTKALATEAIGLEGIQALSKVSQSSLTASAIRAAECCPYPMAVVMSRADAVCYAFLSDGFKQLGRLTFIGKGTPLPFGMTRTFNADAHNVATGRRVCGRTSLREWFDGAREAELDEEVIGLGRYGFTLTVLSSDDLPRELDEEDDDEAELIESYTPRFAYRR
ncbi:MAG: hypothetical protein AcusKO_43060 [Acuticoccus sp.]